MRYNLSIFVQGREDSWRYADTRRNKEKCLKSLCYCASLIRATRKFFYSLSTVDDDQSYVNQRLIESESCDT